MDNLEVIVLQLLVPSCRPPRQFLRGFPVREIFVIRFNDKGSLRPDEVGTPVLQCFDNPQELSVIDVVVLLRGGEGVGVVCDGVSAGFGVR